MPALIWFREDLRIQDQMALYQACQWSQDGVIGVFLMTSKTWQSHDMADVRRQFILNQLSSLQINLNALNVCLIIKEVQEFKNCANTLLEIAQQHNAQAVFFNKQYELDELKRDQAVTALLQKHHLSVFAYDDQVVFSPDTIKTKTGSFFTIFTPFKKAWLNTLIETGPPTVLAKPKKQKTSIAIKTNDTIKLPQNLQQPLWPAEEKNALKQLEHFIDKKIHSYNQKRDYPGEDYTSKLSPYLAAGVLSVRQCLHAAIVANKNSFIKGNAGILTWINELIWREFYKQIVYHVPRVCMYQPYKLNTDKLPWSYNEKLFKAWQEGQTGYPIVDASMRQLKQTNWMHNRSRMIVAMFLSKILFIDWRWGEKHFMQNLIDGDFSANNGGWQWCASTGTDAAPYFRIFNPLLQSKKFDPHGDYIRQYVPELKNFNNTAIHEPYTYDSARAKAANYPPPIIDYKKAREHTLHEFKKLKT